MKAPVQSILVVGSDSQALLTAFALKRLTSVPEVRLLRTSPAGHEDVAGEITPPLFLHYLCRTLGVPGSDLHALGRPVWTLGTKYLWGARGSFYRSYDAIYGSRPPGLPVDPGYLAAEEGLDAASLATALMEAGRLFPRDGAHAARPQEQLTGMNFQAPALEALLIRACQSSGVEMLSGDLAGIERGEGGITVLRLSDGRKIGADLYLDTGGSLRSDTADFLDYPGLCTRALTVLRRRGSDPTRPYATVTQNDSGYQWRVEHDDAVGLGIAWHPAHGDEAQARASLLGKSAALLAGPVLHEWRPGRLQEPWQGNVIALGDASGFLEPLAALRSGVLIMQIDWVRRLLAESEGQPGPATGQLYNRVTGRIWDEMRDFTALHYRFSGSSSPRWQQAWDIDPGGHGELIALFQSLGPTIQLSNTLPFWPGAIGIDGWIATLLGLGVPFTPRGDLPAEALAAWRSHIAANRQIAKQAIDLETCLAAVRKSHVPRVVEDTSY